MTEPLGPLACQLPVNDLSCSKAAGVAGAAWVGYASAGMASRVPAAKRINSDRVRIVWSPYRKGTSGGPGDSSCRCVAAEARVEPAAGGGRAQRLGRAEAIADGALEALEGGDDLRQALLVGPAAEAAAEGGEPGAEDHRQVELAGAPHHLLIEAARCLVDHRQHHAIRHGLQAGIAARCFPGAPGLAGMSRVLRVETERRVDRRVGLLALASLVTIDALAALDPQAVALAQAVEPGRQLHPVGECGGHDVGDLAGDVDADLVGQGERPDRHAPVHHRAVDVLDAV